jgi:cephalosporin hydroxylase
MWRTWYQQGLEFSQPPYRDVPIVKNPCDLRAYETIIHRTKPDLIIETGSYMGGSALWLADRFDGLVISVDLADDRELPTHDRVRFITGCRPPTPAWSRRSTANAAAAGRW